MFLLFSTNERDALRSSFFLKVIPPDLNSIHESEDFLNTLSKRKHLSSAGTTGFLFVSILLRNYVETIKYKYRKFAIFVRNYLLCPVSIFVIIG